MNPASRRCRFPHQHWWVFLATLVLLVPNSWAQTTPADDVRSLLGVWQQGSPEPGSDLGQHFEFKADGSFVLHLNNYDDARDIVKLKGSYRRIGDDLYFTMLSRTIVHGSIGMSNPGFDLNLFTVYPDTIIEVPEVEPVELTTPCRITWVVSDHVKLNNAHYFRLKVPAEGTP